MLPLRVVEREGNEREVAGECLLKFPKRKSMRTEGHEGDGDDLAGVGDGALFPLV